MQLQGQFWSTSRSVLGPTLFLVYINDIANGIQSQLRLFADDCIIYRTINTPEDHTTLQQDLNHLSKWATTWQIKWNLIYPNVTFYEYHIFTLQVSTPIQCMKLN